MAVLSVFLSLAVTAGYPELPVNIGTAANYVALAKTGISTTGTTSIVGNIGVSPAAATTITGFGLIMDSTNQFSTSSLVAGKVYAADYSPTTPDDLRIAVLAMEAAFTDAAGRTTPDAIDAGSGNLGGLTLTPGLYTFTTGVIITSDLTLSGNSDDVWIFQIPGTLDISSGKKVILTGGAQAKNIFWQVAGVTTLNTDSVFSGIILDQTLVAIKTRAVLNGRALAQSAVTLESNAVSLPVSLVNSSLNITTCTEINAPGAFRLINDISGANISASPLANTACVKITSPDVIFDCNGFRITNNGTGGTTFGVLLANIPSNVTVINCPSVSNYSYGVEVFDSNNSIFDVLIASDNAINGFFVDSSVNTSISNAIAYGNGAAFTFVSTAGGSNTVSAVTAHDNVGSVFNFTTTGANNLTGNFASGNNGSAFFFNSTGPNTLTGNIAHGNLDAFTILSGGASNNTLTGNAAYNHAGTGTKLIDSNASMANNHYYNNSPDFQVNGSGAIANLSASIFDSPSGNFTNYTNVSLNDAVNSAYSIHWSASPASLPNGTISFAGKFVNVTPNASIDRITWNWLASELGSYNQSNFMLWGYDGSAWEMLNNTPDTANRTLSLATTGNSSVFAILQNATPTPSPTPTPTPTPAPTATPTATPYYNPGNSGGSSYGYVYSTPTPASTPAPTPVQTATPSPAAFATPAPTPVPTTTPKPSAATPTPVPLVAWTPTPTPTPAPTPTAPPATPTPAPGSDNSCLCGGLLLLILAGAAILLISGGAGGIRALIEGKNKQK